MRKKAFISILMLFLLFAVPAGSYALTGAGSDISSQLSAGEFDDALSSVETVSVRINGVSPLFTYAPILSNDSTLIPVRAVMEHLGCTVGWEDATQTVTVIGMGKNIAMKIGSNEIKVNGTVKSIPAPAELIGEVTYVPLRAVSEALGAVVGWDDNTQTAGIYTYETTHSLSVGSYTVTVGQTVDALFAACGQPSYSIWGENGLIWHVYTQNPATFFTAAADGGIVCGYYTNAPGFSTSDGLAYGAAAPEDGKQYELTKNGHMNVHRYYDGFDKILCSVYVVADGYYNTHDINASLHAQSRLGLDILNSFRAANLLGTLAWDDAAAVCAADHARYMASVGELTHTGADGSSAIQRYLLYNPTFKWTAWGENICAGAKNIFTCMNGWRNSLQHRTIMLSDKAYAGIGMVYSPDCAFDYSAVMLLLK